MRASLPFCFACVTSTAAASFSLCREQEHRRDSDPCQPASSCPKWRLARLLRPDLVIGKNGTGLMSTMDIVSVSRLLGAIEWHDLFLRITLGIVSEHHFDVCGSLICSGDKTRDD
jgi:hypothetical protein